MGSSKKVLRRFDLALKRVQIYVSDTSGAILDYTYAEAASLSNSPSISPVSSHVVGTGHEGDHRLVDQCAKAAAILAAVVQILNPDLTWGAGCYESSGILLVSAQLADLVLRYSVLFPCHD